LDRGERIELLVDKTENLSFQVHAIPWLVLKAILGDLGGPCNNVLVSLYVIMQADSFQRQGRELRRKMWLQNLKVKLVLGGTVLALIVIVWISVCGGFKC